MHSSDTVCKKVVRIEANTFMIVSFLLEIISLYLFCDGELQS